MEQVLQRIRIQRIRRATHDIPIAVITMRVNTWYPASEFKRAMVHATRYVEGLAGRDIAHTTIISDPNSEGPILMTSGKITTLRLHTIDRWNLDQLRTLLGAAGNIGVQHPGAGKLARFKVVYA